MGGSLGIAGGITPTYTTPSFTSAQVGAIIVADTLGGTYLITTTNTWVQATSSVYVPAGSYIIVSNVYAYGSDNPCYLVSKTGYNTSTSTTGVNSISPTLRTIFQIANTTGNTSTSYTDVYTFSSSGTYYFFFGIGKSTVSSQSTTLNTAACTVQLMRVA